MAKKTENSELEVSIVLTEEILQKEPDLKDLYDPKKGAIIYKVPETLTVEYKDEVKSLLEDLKPDEVAAFNPLFFAINQLHEFRSVKPDPELDFKENEKKYQDVKKFMTQYTGANKIVPTLKKQMKEPYDSVIKKINSLFNLIENEFTVTKNALDENFESHIAEKEKKKKEEEERKKAKELEAIKALEEQNKDVLEKNKQQESDNAYLLIKNEINQIVTDAAQNSPKLNIAGLESDMQFLNGINFESVKTNLPQTSLIDEPRLAELNELFNTSLESAKKIILDRIEFLKTQEANMEIKSQNQILAAQNQTMAAQMPVLSDNDLPFPSADQVASPAQTMGELSELDKFKKVLEICQNFKSNVEVVMNEIRSIQLKEDYTVDIQNKLLENSFPQILSWSEKIEDWMKSKYGPFEAYKLNNK